MKKKNTKLVALLGLVVVVIVLLFVGGKLFAEDKEPADTKIVKVGVVGDSDDVIWDEVNKVLAKNGDHIKVKLVKFSDGIYTNQSLDGNELDLTAFQHYAFLNNEIKEKGYKFTVIGESYIVPLNVYSDKYTDISQVKEGDTIAIPNNTTNAGRALKVLEKAGLIKTDASKGYSPTVDDITENKLNLKIAEVDPSQIPSLLPDYAAGITNSNFIIDNNLDPVKDSIYSIAVDKTDAYNKPYINVIVANTKDKNNATYKKVVAAYHTKQVAEKILTEFDGVYQPVFDYKGSTKK